ncbi:MULTISPECIES: S9 family peptidase [unclassified Lentimicrobium]|uniref:alpha/beta hydrolase family protein n=1 Tax=unclassified Lentimicrobium TaxID=2677434 RepID=UPI001553ABBD|nr:MULTISPECIES: hypothetical protein [unclassified Lentimicrobium]NPD46255.1 hypothetical protein [Lentimicrobium sp. S6]NPD83977.1 hypothetical protein [Lentimicrobium sp. L6]
MSRKFIIRAIAVLMLYIAATSYIFQNEDSFFFNHDQLEQNYIYDFKNNFQEMEININPEVSLHALWFKQEKAKGLLLYFPNGDYQSENFDIQSIYYYQMGFDVLIPEYRGNGKSTSYYQSEEDMYKDAQQWYKMAHSLADSSSLIIAGRDFGSGMAAYIGGEFPAELVILENPYYSWNALMLRKYFWMLPHSYLTQFKIPLWEFVRKSTNKTLLIHASESSFTDIENSHRLLQFLKSGDDLIELKGENIDYNHPDFQKIMEKI